MSFSDVCLLFPSLSPFLHVPLPTSLTWSETEENILFMGEMDTRQEKFLSPRGQYAYIRNIRAMSLTERQMVEGKEEGPEKPVCCCNRGHVRAGFLQ